MVDWDFDSNEIPVVQHQKITIPFIDEKGTNTKPNELQLDEPMKYLGVVYQINGIHETQTKELIKVAKK